MKKIIIVSVLAAIVLSIQPPKKTSAGVAAKNINKKPSLLDKFQVLFKVMQQTDAKQQELIVINNHLKQQ